MNEYTGYANKRGMSRGNPAALLIESIPLRRKLKTVDEIETGKSRFWEKIIKNKKRGDKKWLSVWTGLKKSKIT